MKIAEATLKPAIVPTIPVYVPPRLETSHSGGLGMARGVQPMATIAATPTANTINVPTIHII